MPYYYVNKNAPGGDHEVHESGCSQGAALHNQHHLGWHSSCHGAVREAKRSYDPVNGCFYCCNACHTG